MDKGVSISSSQKTYSGELVFQCGQCFLLMLDTMKSCFGSLFRECFIADSDYLRDTLTQNMPTYVPRTLLACDGWKIYMRFQ